MVTRDERDPSAGAGETRWVPGAGDGHRSARAPQSGI